LRKHLAVCPHQGLDKSKTDVVSCNKMKLRLFILLLCGNACLSGSQTLTATRVLPLAYQPGNTLQISLDIEVDETNLPDGVIVTEYIPSGWNLLSASPEASRFLPANGEIKWEFHQKISDTALDITYVVQVPLGETGARQFQGKVRWIDVASMQYETTISGDQFTSDGQPVFYNLQFTGDNNQTLNPNALPVDEPFRIKADYASPDGTSQASSQWQVIGPQEKLIYSVKVESGDLTCCWVGAGILKPQTDYIIKGRASDTQNRISDYVQIQITTVPQDQTKDKDGDGIPDNQKPSPEDLIYYGYNSESNLPENTRIISFNNKAILVENPDGYPLTYFSGIEVNSPDFFTPYGVFLTRIEGITEGETVNLRFIFPEVLPAGCHWYKYDENKPEGQKWQEFPGARITGNMAIISLADGGAGDADGVANGIIVDPSGPVIPRNTGSSGPCFIATVAFGSPLAREVQILRVFRDRILASCRIGLLFIRWYYRHGPAAARYLMGRPLLKLLVRLCLYPVVGMAGLILTGWWPALLLELPLLIVWKKLRSGKKRSLSLLLER